MTIDEAELLAWLDGELAPTKAARVAAAVASDASLTRLAEAHRGVADRLRLGFAPLLAEPVPTISAGSISATPASNVVDFGRRDASHPAAPRFVMPSWTALAATLVIGLVAGTVIDRDGSGLMPADRHDAVMADAGLARALDTQLASDSHVGAVRIALTFRGHNGKLCRTWSVGTQAGIACRAGDVWSIKALTTIAAPSSGEYRVASGAAQQLMATVDAMIDGAPLDATQEADARNASWR